MKTKKIKQKLTLGKNTIANLNLREMMAANGGCDDKGVHTKLGPVCVVMSRINGCMERQLETDAQHKN